MSKALYRDKIEAWKRKDLLVPKPELKTEAKAFLDKAKHNLRVALALKEISEKKEAKELIGEKEDFQCYDWIINASYYAMYQSASGLLAKIGYKSEDHTATIDAIY